MAFSDFGEAVEVGAIAAVEDAFATGLHDIAAVIAMGVVDVAGAPMVAGCVDDVHAADFQFVPDFDFVDGGEAEFFHERGAAFWHHNALAGLQDFEAGLVEVVEVGVGDEHEINFRHIAEPQAGVALAFDGAVPHGPVGVDDYRVSRKLEEKGSVADPSDANAVIFGRG